MVMSVGWNPYFNNAEKTIVSPMCILCMSYLFQFVTVFVKQEPWLLHEFGDDFYGEDLRLAVVGYIRPEVS